MSSMSVGGLLTGFDTKAVVDQLMSVERLAGNKITAAQTKAGALSSALSSLNGLVKSMGDAANAVLPDALMKTSMWNAATATSSNADVVKATTGDSAVAATVSFKVDRVAQAGAAISERTFASRTESLSGDAFDLTLVKGADVAAGSATSTKVTLAAGATLNDIAKAINDSDAGVNATIVQVSEGTYRLQLTSKETGAASNVTLTDGNTPPGAHGLLGSFNTLYNGRDTKLTVGEGANAYSVTSSTTKVDGLMQGVSLTVAKASDTPVTISVARDPDAIATKVQAMVEAANAALTNVRINSKVEPNLGRAEAGKENVNNSGLFVGNSTTRSITSRISDVFVGSSANLPMLAGISIDRNGAATFDKAKFMEAYAKDPAAVEKNVTATAQRLVDTSKAITNSTDGTLTVAVRGQEAAVKDYANQVKRFNDRMTAKQEVLTRQYDALDAMLSKLKSQGDWLAGQLKSLPTIESMKN